MKESVYFQWDYRIKPHNKVPTKGMRCMQDCWNGRQVFSFFIHPLLLSYRTTKGSLGRIWIFLQTRETRKDQYVCCVNVTMPQNRKTKPKTRRHKGAMCLLVNSAKTRSSDGAKLVSIEKS